MKHYYSAKVSKVDSDGEFISTRSLDHKYYSRLMDTKGIIEKSVKTIRMRSRWLWGPSIIHARDMWYV